jgi:hypothetical protein
MIQHKHIHRPTLLYMSLMAVVGVLALMLGASAAMAHSTKQTFTIQSSPPAISYFDQGPPGKGTGDKYVFNSRLLRNGKRIGRLHGVKETIRLEGSEEIVQSTLTFQFSARNTIIVTGISRVTSSGREVGLITGEPFVRAVVGGTGRFRDATGQLTSTRLQNGNYRQKFQLKFHR